MATRAWDVVVATLAMILLSPLFALAALATYCDSRGPVFFRQRRIGRGFEPFDIYKFRTMVEEAAESNHLVTVGRDPRITRIGRILRKTKIDELPQLINVIKGEMSLVGPRPEVPKYVAMFRDDYAEILEVRPGLTDLASIKYVDEAEQLGQTEDPEAEYVTRILPEKIRLAKEYLARSSFCFDVGVVLHTLLRILKRRS